jgi:hypothetical protein
MPFTVTTINWLDEDDSAPVLQGSDFIDVVTFSGWAGSWSGFLVRGQLREDFGTALLAEIKCTILDVDARTVRFFIPAAVTAEIDVDCGRWDAELYRFDESGAETSVMRFVQGRWELSREVTR